MLRRHSQISKTQHKQHYVYHIKTKRLKNLCKNNLGNYSRPLAIMLLCYAILNLVYANKSRGYAKCWNLLIVYDLGTVKPVYNDHPWDLKNMAVMQRVVWKRSVVSRLQAGRYGLRLAIVDRWPLFRGGR